CPQVTSKSLLTLIEEGDHRPAVLSQGELAQPSVAVPKLGSAPHSVRSGCANAGRDATVGGNNTDHARIVAGLRPDVEIDDDVDASGFAGAGLCGLGEIGLRRAAIGEAEIVASGGLVGRLQLFRRAGRTRTFQNHRSTRLGVTAHPTLRSAKRYRDLLAGKKRHLAVHYAPGRNIRQFAAAGGAVEL